MDTTNQKYDNSYKNVVKINSIIKYFYIISMNKFMCKTCSIKEEEE